jgi:hypothetical protein
MDYKRQPTTKKQLDYCITKSLLFDICLSHQRLNDIFNIHVHIVSSILIYDIHAASCYKSELTVSKYSV